MSYQLQPPQLKTKNHGREKMILSNGAIYRMGQRIKDCGERIGHFRMFGIHFLNWLAGPVIRLGLAIRNSVMQCPLCEM